MNEIENIEKSNNRTLEQFTSTWKLESGTNDYARFMIGVFNSQALVGEPRKRLHLSGILEKKYTTRIELIEGHFSKLKMVKVLLNIPIYKHHLRNKIEGNIKKAFQGYQENPDTFLKTWNVLWDNLTNPNFESGFQPFWKEIQNLHFEKSLGSPHSHTEWAYPYNDPYRHIDSIRLYIRCLQFIHLNEK